MREQAKKVYFRERGGAVVARQAQIGLVRKKFRSDILSNSVKSFAQADDNTEPSSEKSEKV